MQRGYLACRYYVLSSHTRFSLLECHAEPASAHRLTPAADEAVCGRAAPLCCGAGHGSVQHLHLRAPVCILWQARSSAVFSTVVWARPPHEWRRAGVHWMSLRDVRQARHRRECPWRPLVESDTGPASEQSSTAAQCSPFTRVPGRRRKKDAPRAIGALECE
jgi:hypothetical protein